MRFDRRAPSRIDIVVAALLTATTIWEALANEVPTPSGFVLALDVVAAAALAWRRIAPVAVAVVVAVTYLVPPYLGHMTDNFSNALVSLVAAYTCACYASSWRRAAIGCGALALAWAYRGWVEYGSDLGAAVIGAGWIVQMAIIGAIVRRRMRAESTARRRAVQAEESVEERAAAAVALERQRIARELHDVVAHSLSVIVVQARGGRAMLEVDVSRTRDSLTAIESVAVEALQEMRRLVGGLRATGEDSAAPFAPLPGLDQVEALAEHSMTPGTSVALRCDGDLARVPEGVGVSAYRIIQESLSNVRQHAKATRVDVDIRVGQDAVALAITDDGAGPDGHGPGFGILGMQERASFYGGTLSAGPGPTGGFRVAAVLPLNGTVRR